MKELSVHCMHHVPKCLSCKEAILVIIRRVHCFHDYIRLAPISEFSFLPVFTLFYLIIYIYIYIHYIYHIMYEYIYIYIHTYIIYIYINNIICVTCSKRTNSLGQILKKIKHKKHSLSVQIIFLIAEDVNLLKRIFLGPHSQGFP